MPKRTRDTTAAAEAPAPDAVAEAPAPLPDLPEKEDFVMVDKTEAPVAAPAPAVTMEDMMKPLEEAPEPPVEPSAKRGKPAPDKELYVVNMKDLSLDSLFIDKIGKFKNNDGKRCMVYRSPTAKETVYLRIEDAVVDWKYGFGERVDGNRVSYSLRITVPPELEERMAAFDDAFWQHMLERNPEEEFGDFETLRDMSKEMRSVTIRGQFKDKKLKEAGGRWPRRFQVQLGKKRNFVKGPDGKFSHVEQTDEWDFKIRDTEGTLVEPSQETLNSAKVKFAIVEIKYVTLTPTTKGFTMALKKAVIDPSAGSGPASTDDIDAMFSS